MLHLEPKSSDGLKKVTGLTVQLMRRRLQLPSTMGRSEPAMVAPAKASPFTPLSTLHLTKTVEELNGLMVLDLKAGPFVKRTAPLKMMITKKKKQKPVAHKN